VLVLAPYWTTYPEVIALAGGVPVVIPTSGSSGFRVSLDQLEAARTARTKVLLFVSPSNPTGAVYPREEIEAIGRWADEHGLWVLTDEIYEHLVYGDVEHHSMPVLVPELADRCIVVNGVAKTYAMTGWRVGWMIGPGDVVTAATNLQSHETSNVANVSQRAALAAVSGDLEAVAMMRAAFDRRRLTIHTMLNEIEGVTCNLPEGAFYAFPSVEGVLGRDIRGQVAHSSAELAELAIEEAKVAVVPGEAFGAPGYFRMSYALGDDDLVEGVSRLAKLFGDAS
jgi:aspartate aminotransferase